MGNSSVHQYFDNSIRQAIRDSIHAFPCFEPLNDNFPNHSTFVRAVRRLVAARVDTDASSSEPLEPWERFAIPPLGENLLTADILRKSESDWEDEDAFRLVLTLSCDLARHRNNKPKVEYVLAARCEPITSLGRKWFPNHSNLNSKQKKSYEKRLKGAIREGVTDNTYIPIPQFANHVPVMVANLKKLELISLDSVCTKKSKTNNAANRNCYRRVASTDSPFREMVVWAHLRVMGRPGIPEIKIQSWIEDALQVQSGSS